MQNEKYHGQFQALHVARSQPSDDPAAAHKRKLAELAERLYQYHVFTKGHFVIWKPGLKNRKFPEYGEPAIVGSVLPDAIFDPSENAAGSPYFQEPLSFMIGVVCDDDFIEFRVDGRRFEPADGRAAT